MGFVNRGDDKKPKGLPGWLTLVFLAVTCLSIFYVAYRALTGGDPLEFIARKGHVLVGIAQDKKKMVTE